MPRNLTAAMQQLAAAGLFPAAIFAEIPWQQTVLRVWSGVGPITWGAASSISPSHEWDFNQQGTAIADQWGWVPLTASNLTWATYAGMGAAPVAAFNGTTSHATSVTPDVELSPGFTHPTNGPRPIASISETVSFDGSAPFSVAFWVYVSAMPARQSVITNLNSAANGLTGWEVALDPQTGVNFYLINSWTTNCINVAAGAVAPGAAHHVCVTYDGSRKASGVAVYVDGAARAPTIVYDSLTASAANNNPVSVGARNDGTQPFDGAVAFVETYPSALTAANVQMLYGAGPVAGTTVSPLTFIGLGNLGAISSITEASTVNATSVSLTLSGIEPITLQDGLTQLNQGNMARIWLGAVQNGVVVADPMLIYQGMTDQVGVDVSADTATVKLSLESRLSDLQRGMMQKYTAQWQEQRYPGDVCLNAVEKLIDVQLFWH